MERYVHPGVQAQTQTRKSQANTAEERIWRTRPWQPSRSHAQTLQRSNSPTSSGPAPAAAAPPLPPLLAPLPPLPAAPPFAAPPLPAAPPLSKPPFLGMRCGGVRTSSQDKRYSRVCTSVPHFSHAYNNTVRSFLRRRRDLVTPPCEEGEIQSNFCWRDPVTPPCDGEIQSHLRVNGGSGRPRPGTAARPIQGNPTTFSRHDGRMLFVDNA